MEENTQTQARPTGIRQPMTRLPQSAFSSSVNGHGLTEISDSQSNTRAQHSAIPAQKRSVPPPAAVPNAKRIQQNRNGASSVAGSRMPQGTSLSALSRSSSSATNSSRYTSNSSYASNSSFANSMGPGTRPLSRSQTSHLRTRSAVTRTGRPATSIGTREEGNGKNVNDIDERVGKMDAELQRVREFMESTEKSSANVKEELEMARKRVAHAEDERNELQTETRRLKDKLEDAERMVSRREFDLQQERDHHARQLKLIKEDHERELDTKGNEFNRKMDELEKLQQEFEERCGAQAEARLEDLSHDNKELRLNLERQKRDYEREVQLLQEDVQRRESDLRKAEEELRKSASDHQAVEAQVRDKEETIARLKKRAEDAEERLSNDKGQLGGQIKLLSSTLDLKSEHIQRLDARVKEIEAEAEQQIHDIKAAAQKRIDEETNELKQKLIKEEERRHKLFEQVQELKGNIRVMCRIKPPSNPAGDSLIPFKPKASDIDEEKIDGLSIPTVREDPTEPGKLRPGKPKDFSFERVFDERCSNSDVFDEISQLVQSVMDGKKVCIFCYGQTGSGKTFTMSKRAGDGDDGVIPRTQQMIFGEVERLKALGWEFTVEGSYLEVYQDRLYDLLASRNSKPEPLSVDPIGDELHIKGHDFTLLKDEHDLDAMVKTADANRHVAATVKNDRSSRSHSILVLKVNGVKRNEAGEVVKTRKGTLNLIDLAGSEKPDKTGAPQVYQEGVQINSSLSYLRTVLSGLGQGRTEGVDFRSYTLTQLLRPSLGKGCRTLMFVMVSPLKENENETIRSLEFARDAQMVKMGGGAKSKK